jgi:hypothetical protein
MPQPTVFRSPMACPHLKCQACFQDKQSLQNHFNQHKEDYKIRIEDPKMLAILVTVTEKSIPDIRPKLDYWLGMKTNST